MFNFSMSMRLFSTYILSSSSLPSCRRFVAPQRARRGRRQAALSYYLSSPSSACPSLEADAPRALDTGHKGPYAWCQYCSPTTRAISS
eukprot:COSAG02_NODE_4739_length_5036_cov_10.879684_2_plen_88_part_00